MVICTLTLAKKSFVAIFPCQWLMVDCHQKTNVKILLTVFLDKHPSIMAVVGNQPLLLIMCILFWGVESCQKSTCEETDEGMLTF